MGWPQLQDVSTAYLEARRAQLGSTSEQVHHQRSSAQLGSTRCSTTGDRKAKSVELGLTLQTCQCTVLCCTPPTMGRFRCFVFTLEEQSCHPSLCIFNGLHWRCRAFVLPRLLYNYCSTHFRTSHLGNNMKMSKVLYSWDLAKSFFCIKFFFFKFCPAQQNSIICDSILCVFKASPINCYYARLFQFFFLRQSMT